jgi:predicted kinase
MRSGLYVVGPPGAGKSTLVEFLEHSIGIPNADSDWIRKLIFERRRTRQNEGDALLDGTPDCAFAFQRWQACHDDAVLKTVHSLVGSGYVVELGGELGLHLSARQRRAAICLLPPVEVIRDRVEARAAHDIYAARWLSCGGRELVEVWFSEFDRLDYGHGTHAGARAALDVIGGALSGR